MPTPLFKSLRAALLVPHGISRAHRAGAGEDPPAARQAQTVVRDSADPPHVVRWLDDERLLVTGADIESPPERLKRQDRSCSETGQLMYELSTLYPEISGIQPAYGWERRYARTADGLPYIGPHRNFPHHLFAFGDSSHSVTGAYLASRILLRHYLDELEPADEAFGFKR